MVPGLTDALLIGMGERFDVLVTLGDGAFPLVASAEGKTGQGLAVVRTAAGPLPAADVAPLELDRTVRLGTDLRADPRSGCAAAGVDRTHDLVLGGSMAATAGRSTARPSTRPTRSRSVRASGCGCGSST